MGVKNIQGELRVNDEVVATKDWVKTWKNELPAITATFNITKENTTISLNSLGEMAIIDWGDGIVSREQKHIYKQAGTYKCEIYYVKYIGADAFKDCINLISVNLSDEIVEIEKGSFYGCNNLVDIVLPFVGRNKDAVEYEGVFGYIFGYIRLGNLESAPDGLVKQWQEINTGYIYYYYIPNSIKSVTITGNSINTGAFLDCNNLINVRINDGVTSIGSIAFSGCSSLTSIELPESIIEIGVNSFKNCNSLSFSIFDNGKYLNSKSNGYFALIELVTKENSSYEIHNQCQLIAGQVFSSCSNLIEVIIPNSVTNIGVSAFSDCDNLTNVVIPNSVTSIGSSAFYNCSSLAEIIIPDSVTSISDSAFSRCRRLTSVVIPDSVTSIGDSAFWYCSSLTSVVIPDSVTSIGDSAFWYCSSLTEVVIPDSVTSIGDSAFYDCSSLAGVYITDIAAWCSIEFKNQDSNPLYYARNLYLNNKLLTELIIPNYIKNIKSYAFYNCDSLKTLVIGNGTVNIGSNVFYHCDELISITVGESVSSALQQAFRANSQNFNKIIFKNLVPIQYDSTWFQDCAVLTHIYVPYGCKQAYIDKWTADGAKQDILDKIVESDREAMMNDVNALETNMQDWVKQYIADNFATLMAEYLNSTEATENKPTAAEISEVFNENEEA